MSSCSGLTSEYLALTLMIHYSLQLIIVHLFSLFVHREKAKACRLELLLRLIQCLNVSHQSVGHNKPKPSKPASQVNYNTVSEPPSSTICPYFYGYLTTNTEEISKIRKVLDNPVNILFVELIIKYRNYKQKY